MNAEDVRYPAFLFRPDNSKPVVFAGPRALFISGRFRPLVGPLDGEILVDGIGRTWMLQAVEAVGRWGALRQRLALWWRREYFVDFAAAEGPPWSLADLKAKLTEIAVSNEADLKADTEIDEMHRRIFLEGWRQNRDEIASAESFEAAAGVVGLHFLRRDHWFSFECRSNRVEYLSVLLFVLIGAAVDLLAANLPYVALLVPVAVVFAALAALALAATFRRLHDWGSASYLLAIPLFVGWLAEQVSIRFLNGKANEWMPAGVWLAFLVVLAIVPGTQGENIHGPQPNPGPSL